MAVSLDLTEGTLNDVANRAAIKAMEIFLLLGPLGVPYWQGIAEQVLQQLPTERQQAFIDWVINDDSRRGHWATSATERQKLLEEFKEL